MENDLCEREEEKLIKEFILWCNSKNAFKDIKFNPKVCYGLLKIVKYLKWSF